jgi:hypothetical protein
MFRKLFTFLAALSLALCVAAGVLWGRSHRAQKVVRFSRHGTQWEITSSRGLLVLDNLPQRQLEADAHARRQKELMHECVRLADDWVTASRRLNRVPADQRPAIQADCDRLNAERQRNAKDRLMVFRAPAMTTPLVSRSVRYAGVVLAAAQLPMGWMLMLGFRRQRMRNRKSAGKCLHCGYDLRGSPGRCPECGEAHHPCLSMADLRRVRRDTESTEKSD